ncbi:hypothetical protein C0991_007363 [Blastosporella zonata]|nr:hypothetical protein C0991_007363 [Blastosporella zonata]
MTEETKISRFMKGLKPAVKDGLVPIVDRPKTLKAWEPIIISIDNNLHQCEIERRHEGKSSNKKNNNYSQSYSTAPSTSKSPDTSSSNDTAMDVDAITTASSAPCGPLSKAERKRRFKNNLCLYCGDAGHKVTDFLKRKHVNEQGKGQKSKTA